MRTKDIVIEHPVTKRVVRCTVGLIGPEHTTRCLIEARVGGLESAAHYLNSVGIWARVASFHERGATYSLDRVDSADHWSDSITNTLGAQP